MNKKPSRVLIVDDARINRMILSSLLASNGVTSDEAEGGQECIDLCRKNAYDLILLDHRMPEIDGVDTLVQLKEIFKQQGRTVPVVCHTTEDARNNINLYKAAGFADVLIKPIQPKHLSEILMTYLPEGAPDDQRQSETQKKLDEEFALLPAWLHDIRGLNLRSALEHCETAEDFLDALQVFVTSISEKSKEIEHFLNEGNWQMYTLRVHSLKSMARLIGADELSELAAGLEAAGKQTDVDKMMKGTPSLLENYRAFSSLLSHISQDDTAPELPTDTILPDISDATLDDAYAAIMDFASCYDMDSIRMVLDSLEEYHLSYPDSEHVKDIRKAVDQSDWEALRHIINNRIVR